MKRCARCGATKELEEFDVAARNRDGRHPYCRSCHRAYYAENAERHRARVRVNTERARQRARAVCLVRLRDLQMIRFGRALALIEKELAKCEVRCRNCHAIATAARRPEGNWFDGIEGYPRRDSNSRPCG
jgi:hypothetical protein